MNRRNFALSAVALTAMALVPFTACKKDGGGGASGSSSDMLSYMPKDSSVIIGFSVKKATSSALFKKYQDKVMEDAGKELAEMKEKCNIDMMADMNSLVVAIGDIQNPDNAVIGVKGNFDQKKIEECVTKMGGKVEGSVMTSPDGDIMNAFWAAKDTILISKGMTADAIKASKDGASVKQNKDLMELIGKVDSGATVWVAGMIPPEAAGMMGPMGGTPPKSGYLSLNIDSGVSANVGMVFNSEDEAKAMSTMLEMVMGMGKSKPELKEILDAVSTTQQGTTLTIKAKVTGDQMAKLESMAPGM